MLSGLAIFDAIKQLQLDVVVYGSAMSIAGVILQAGAQRNCHVMVKQGLESCNEATDAELDEEYQDRQK